jgi:hypothetical protein
MENYDLRERLRKAETEIVVLNQQVQSLDREKG